MTDRKNKKLFFFTAVFLIVGIAGILTLYFGHMQIATEEMVRATMKEVAAHDSENIEAKVNAFWTELDNIYERVFTGRTDTLGQICERLQIEQTSGKYRRVFLVDDEGKTYYGNGRIMDRSHRPHVKKLLAGEKRIALNYEYREDGEIKPAKEVLAIGSRKWQFTRNGITFIGIIGIVDLQQMEKELKLDCFEGAGQTTVIDYDGYYIINEDRSHRSSGRDNYFEELKEACKVSGQHIERIRTKIHAEHEFYDKLDCTTQKEEIAYYHKLGDTEWVMIISVPESVITQSGRRFAEMSGTMLLALILVLILAALISVRFFVKAMRERSNSEARSEFLSMMSHEIRTPLNGLIALNYLMQNNIKDEEKMREYLRKSASTGQYLLSLINDILDMSKLQAGKIELFEQPFSLSYMLSTVESIIRSRMEDKKIRFQIDRTIFADVLVGDETRIEQILMNILGNASKFADEGGHVTLTVTQRAAGIGKVETTYVTEDDGCGMTEEFQKHIFDSFAQESNRTNNSLKGTGLGMPISLLLVQQMGGSLEVKSRLGEGSVFTLKIVSEISYETPDTVVLSDSIERGEESGKAGQRLRILLAEDQDLNAEILTELLEDEGFAVDRAADGGEVVDLFEQSAPYTYDLILMDVQMPKRNGYEASKVIRALNREDAKEIVIYACTANAFKEDRERALESGMNDFISKPINVEKLLKKLEVNFSGGGKSQNPC